MMNKCIHTYMDPYIHDAYSRCSEACTHVSAHIHTHTCAHVARVSSIGILNSSTFSEHLSPSLCSNAAAPQELVSLMQLVRNFIQIGSIYLVYVFCVEWYRHGALGAGFTQSAQNNNVWLRGGLGRSRHLNSGSISTSSSRGGKPLSCIFSNKAFAASLPMDCLHACVHACV